MQTLRKKTSPCKYKNEPSRFLGDGVSFKAKLIGILEVSEARGDRMCQEALADLKMAIRAAGEHKQRITINIAIDGLRLRDEKTGDSLYHHPVHKISFIAQDMSDSRAFGYIFGSPDTGHRFFGIKTDKAASQVVIAMRDLFQVVFELKKKEIELAKQHIEQKTRFSSSTAASLFAESVVTSNKSEKLSKLASVSENGVYKKVPPVSDGAAARVTSSASPAAPGATSSESAIADLVDLELELNSIQQGIHQMERITPSDPFGPGSDPFGDSFTSFPQKPFLPPPPPSGGRERQSRTTSDSSSIFSPKTPKTPKIETATQATETTTLFVKTQSNDDQSSCDWFTPTGGADSLFEDSLESKETDPASTTETTATTTTGVTTTSAVESSSNASILSQFDIFTELDPLGTGRSKPYIDKKLFFHELKNPPKKVLKDLITEIADMPPQQFANFDSKPTSTGTTALFQTDPFAYGDPFDKTDPFAEDFVVVAKEQDPFDTDFVGVGDFKLFHNQKTDPAQDKHDKIQYFSSIAKEKKKYPPDSIGPLYSFPLVGSPIANRRYTRQKSLLSPRTTVAQLTKQNTLFDVKFEPDQKSPFSKMNQLHENPSLDMSSESECAPEPPPRPTTNITPIKPPPLPPKKQAGDLSIKPPPRPPHTEESHYDYMESYETGVNSLDGFEALETPPLPVPARKSRFDSEFAPQRPKKQFQGSSDEDYLVPNAPPLLPPQKKGPILLPPPQRTSKRDRSTNPTNQVTVASFLESKPKLTSTMASEKLNLTTDTLDITLSQLTLSGLNELANKLNIPPSQLSNMTLVQLTSYLSNYVSEKPETNNDATFPTFQADFGANFNDSKESTDKSEPYDRYAVFRELLQQEDVPNTKEVEPPPPETPETIQVEEPAAEAPLAEEEEDEKSENTTFKSTIEESTEDRYAALREIIIEETVEVKENNVEPPELEEDEVEEDEEKKQNDLNQESIIDEVEKLNKEVESNIIDYELTLEPLKDNVKTPNLVKSPIPIAITEIIQNSNHLTSGSVSDVVSGSSPEIDNVGSNSETVTKKNVENTTRESWAIFDTPNHQRAVETKEKQPVQSEEGVSPWSSDSKEFGNGSPSDWHQRRDSGSEGEWARRRRDRDGTWWDTQGESGHYEKPIRAGYQRERRSTDSYDDEWYEPDRPTRRRTRAPQPTGGSGVHAWNKTGTGGQSSSSRDVSPWEEEDAPRGPGGRNRDWPPCRRSRGPSWDRHRRRDDSWDEEDDYEYEDEYMSKFHWPGPHGSRDSDRASRDSDRHSGPREPPDHWDAGGDQWGEERRHVRRRAHPPQEERWNRPDWDHEPEKVPGPKEKLRYGGSRWPNQDGKWRAEHRKRDSESRYYKRDHSQESPWEDDYSNDPDEPHSPRYMSSARRTWKRPSSASEMDRKSGEIKLRQPYYLGAGGSDGERTARRTNRRSRSRDSQFAELPHSARHKPDTSLTLGRYPHRSRDNKYNQMFENEFPTDKPKLEVKLDPSKKSATLGRKKTKEPTLKMDNEPEKRSQLKFENDFVNSETDSPVAVKNNNKFNFENDTSEADSPVNRYSKPHREEHFKRNLRHKRDPELKTNRQVFKSDLSDRESTSKSVSPLPVILKSQKSLFEDDFSPTDKPQAEGNGITAIAEEESAAEPRVSFTENNLDKVVCSEPRKSKLLAKNRIGNNIRGDPNLKKSESVNIFARENDPFDDDFFSGRENCEVQSVDNVSPTGGESTVGVVAAAAVPNTDFKWTEDFDSFDIALDETK